jgi:2'-5' RNA ligase
MSDKTHQTAVVLIPPEECWEPIQAIRRKHDRQIRRWMPHVTLLYPFRPREAFDEATVALHAAVRDRPPFDLALGEFRHFDHGRGRFTLWVVPEPTEVLQRLQASLQSAVPDCDDVSRHAHGFAPHLSVGQVRGRAALDELLRRLQDSWEPLRFTVNRVSLIWRNKPPDDVFRVDREIRLGGRA